MARDISGRLILRGTLVARTPLHVGGLGDDVDSDLPVARDGASRLYVPGTSLAGALRQWCEQRFGMPLAEKVWGFQEDDRGDASHVVVEDAVIEGSDSGAVEVRDGVGIDRGTGAAAEHIKYDRAVLPRGTKLPLMIVIEIGERHIRSETLAMFAVLRDALTLGEVRLGGSTTRGLGRVALQPDATITDQAFNTRAGILATLKAGRAGTPIPAQDLDEALEKHQPNACPRLEIAIDWEPVGPLMVKAGFDGIAVDMLPLMSGVDGKLSLVLPGSSVKGALRSHAERIVRTLLDRELSTEVDPKRKFLLDVDLPLINEFFGLRGLSADDMMKRAQAAPTSGPLPGKGALGVDDCYALQRLSVDQWRRVAAAENDQGLRAALDGASAKDWQIAYHVAVDRWTGSAAESFLYTVLEPHGVAWEPLRISVDLARIANIHRLPAVSLLLLVLRDLAAGRLPLGFGTHRGFGSVKLSKITVSTKDTEGPLKEFDGIIHQDGQFTELLAQRRADLNNHWLAWIASASKKEGAR
jgi:CRISPR/Cas system CSM-associated protein Csm3 (group 7 of RAMP superfamily)